MKNTLIDTNIFLELLLDQEKADACSEILNDYASGKKSAHVSSFTIDTIIIILQKHKISLKKIEYFIKSIIKSNGLLIYDLKTADRLASIKLIEKYKLDYEDAIILQSAISCNCSEILSFDKHFDKIKEINRIEP